MFSRIYLIPVETKYRNILILLLIFDFYTCLGNFCLFIENSVYITFNWMHKPFVYIF